jgi:hypothetical protein
MFTHPPAGWAALTAVAIALINSAVTIVLVFFVISM